MKPIRMWAEMRHDGTLANMSDGTPFLWLEEPSSAYFAEPNKVIPVVLSQIGSSEDMAAEVGSVVSGYDKLHTLIKKMQEIIPTQKPTVDAVAKWLFDNFPHDPNAVHTAPYWTRKAKAFLTLFDYEEPAEMPEVEPVPISVNCAACNEGTPFPCHTAEVARNVKCWRFESGRAEG